MSLTRQRRNGGECILERAAPEGQFPRIQGTAARYYDGSPGTEFRLYDDVVERIMPGAFDRALEEQQDVVALFNHDQDKVLGRSSAGTLMLLLQDDGLHYEIQPSTVSHYKDTAEMIARGDISQSSFGFSIPEGGETIRREDGQVIREVRNVNLYDVSPVTRAAYQATAAKVRSLEIELPPEINRKFYLRRARAMGLISGEQFEKLLDTAGRGV